MILFATFMVAASLAHAQTINLDLDGDGLSDQVEDANGNAVVDDGETDPRNADSDRGGEADGSESRSGRDPLTQTDDITFDKDGDGLTNGEEWILGTNPNESDTDGDGESDGSDPFPFDREFSQDGDADGMPDEYEEREGFSDVKRSDAEEDADADGLSNLEEFQKGTDPLAGDTDRDGETDGRETASGTDPLENPCLVYSAGSAQFADLQGHWSGPYVQTLHQTKTLPEYRRIIDGYETENGRSFLPERPITRYELLKMAIFASCIPLDYAEKAVQHPFADVPHIARPRESEDRIRKRISIYTAVSIGAVEGYPDGTFRPDAPVNRAEALKILVKISDLKPLKESPEATVFQDVPEDAWFHPSLALAAEHGVIEGYADGTFRPDRLITRAEAAKILLLLMLNNPHINGYAVPTDAL